jgi:subtilisin-like proprotein convertase family protein
VIRRGALTALIALAATATLAASASATTFNNTEAIKSAFTDSGPLLPYPSQIFVQGQQGSVVKAAVTLPRIAHERIDELTAILVAPGGQKARFMSEVCAQQDTTTNPLTFTFDDSAAASLPDTGPCTSGTYKSSDHFFSASTFDFTYPAPPHPYPPTLAAMIGTEPNGAWKLFMFDGTIGEPGSIEGGWSLDLTTTGAPAAKKKCKKKHKRSAAAAKKCRKKRR